MASFASVGRLIFQASSVIFDPLDIIICITCINVVIRPIRDSTNCMVCQEVVNVCQRSIVGTSVKIFHVEGRQCAPSHATEYEAEGDAQIGNQLKQSFLHLLPRDGHGVTTT